MTLDLLSVLFIVVAIGIVLLFFVLPRWGPHYTSRLTCPHCKRVFNFHWIPGATISSILYRGMRTLKCPYCKIKSNYDVMATRVRQPRKLQKPKSKA